MMPRLELKQLNLQKESGQTAEKAADSNFMNICCVTNSLHTLYNF